MDVLKALLAEHGLMIVFLNVLISQIGLPVPALPMLVIAGALLAQGSVHLAPLVFVVIAGSLLGDTPWYLAGRRYGYRMLRTLCRVAIEPDSCVKQTERIFTRWGPPSLLIAKYIPGFATVAPPLAGTMGVGLGRFFAFSAVAAVLWAAAPVAGGFFFHTEVDWVLSRIEAMGAGALFVIALILIGYIAIKLVQRYMLLRFLRMIRITPTALREMMAGGAEPLILDARSALARQAEPRRIPGAIEVDLDTVESIVGTVAPDRDVVVYCS